MEVLCKSDYQDVYRIKDGVLLVINKFEYVCDEKGCRKFVCNISRKNSKTYADGCKDLKTITKRIIESEEVYEVGQVVYHNYPIELSPREAWNYQIKTTGDSFSGTSEEVLNLVKKIENAIQ